MFFDSENEIRPADFVERLKPAPGFERYSKLRTLYETYLKYQSQESVELLSNEVENEGSDSSQPRSKDRGDESISKSDLSKSGKASRNVNYQVSDHLLTPTKAQKGDTITIETSGSIKIGPFACYSGPDGVSDFSNYSYFPEAMHAALLVRVKSRDDDEWTICGSNCSFTSEHDGSLEFLVNDKDSSNNSGFYAVKVKITK